MKKLLHLCPIDKQQRQVGLIYDYSGEDCLLAIPNDITKRQQDKAAIAQATHEISLNEINTLPDFTTILGGHE